MTRTSVSEVLARANAAMVGADLDVTGALARLLTGVTASLPASAAAVLVDTDGSLEVLAATSHRALDLEMHQAQHVDHDHLAAGLRAALEDRSVVELAKGALAHTRSLDMAEAYDALVALADHEAVTLGVAARRVMDRAGSGTLDARPAGS